MRRLLPLALLLVFAACDSSEPAAADRNDTVIVDYEGRLLDGTVFDSGSAVRIPLRQTIDGFREGIDGMAIGETKTFQIAPEDGYGSTPPPGIPVNATLEFTVTLLDIL